MSDFGSFASLKDKCLQPYHSQYMKTIELDEKVAFSAQLQQDVSGGVVLVIMYTVNPEDQDQFIKIWAEAAEISKKTSGVIAAQLHKGIAGSNVFLAYLVFESTEAIRQQYSNPNFPAKLSEYPANIVVSTHVFKKVAVPGICMG
jgi:quinol monooxygenase YgiN